MNGFLEEIAGINHKRSHASAVYNNKFFSNYVDINSLIRLLLVAHNYVSVVELLGEMHDSKENLLLETLNSEYETISKEIEDIKKKQMELCLKKISNDNFIMQAYKDGEDPSKIAAIIELSKELDSLIEENNKRLNKLMSDRKKISKEREKIENKRQRIGIEIKKIIEKLKEMIAELDGKGINILGETDLEALKEEYERGLVNIIPNEKARKTYVDYMFEILKREIQCVREAYIASKKFVGEAKEEEDFYVDELVDINNKLRMFNEINERFADELTVFASVWCYKKGNEDKATNIITKGYSDVKEFIISLYNYAESLGTLKGNSDDYYDTLARVFVHLQERYTELLRKDSGMISRILGVGQSIERIPYDVVNALYSSISTTPLLTTKSQTKEETYEKRVAI